MAATNGADAVLQLQDAREAAVKSAQFTAETLTQSLDEHFMRTVQGVDILVQLAGDEMRRRLSQGPTDSRPLAPLNEFLRGLASRAPQVRTLAILDATGRVTFHSEDGPNPPYEVARAPSLATLRDNPTRGFVLSEPRRRLFADSTHFIPLERRIEHPDGSFAGIAMAALDPAYFEEFYSRLQKHIVTRLGIFSTDGQLLVQISHPPIIVQRDVANMALFRRFLPQSPTGSYYVDADEYGPDRYVSYRTIEGTPYVIAAMMPEQLVLAEWHIQARQELTKSALIAAVVLGLVLLLVFATYRRDRLSADLRMSEARFRDFTEAASDWYWEMGPDLRFNYFSGRFQNTLGTSEDIIGKHRDDLVDPENLPANWEQHLDDLRNHRPFRDFTYSTIAAGRGRRHCKVSGKPIFNADGRFVGYRGTGTDITKEVLAEKSAARAQFLMTEALEEILEGFVLYDADDRLALWNTQYAQLHRDTADLIIAGSRFEDIIRAAAGRGVIREASGQIEEWVSGRLAAHRSPRSVHERQLSDGRWIRVHECRLSDGGYVGIHTDITDAKRRETELGELARKNALFAAAVTTSTSGVIITDPNLPDNPIVYVNAAFTKLTGYEAEEAIGRSARFLRAPHADPAAVEAIETAWRERHATEARLLNVRKDGTPFYADVRISPVHGADGHVSHFVAIQNDVTPQVLAEEAVRERDEQIRSIAANLPGVVLQRVQRPDGSMHYAYMSERSVELSGYGPQEFLNDHNLIWRIVDPADVGAYRQALQRSAENMESTDVEFRLIRRDGARRWARGMFQPRRAANGDLIWDGMVFDVTDRVVAEEKLRESEARLRGIAANLPGVVYQRVSHRDGGFDYAYVSERCLDLSGYTVQEWMSDPQLIRSRVVPEHLPAYEAVVRRSARDLRPGEIELPFVTKSGETRWWRSMFQPRRMPNGDILWDGLVLDVTDQKRVEQQRADLENQLRHSQKIEALGTLAGGIAHDVNNTLVPIVALSKMTLKALPADSPHRDHLQTILEASYRVRDLVAQILAFSRKEMPKTHAVRLQDIVTTTVRLLVAMIPANVSLTPVMASDVGPVKADENQIVQVLMNLCTNAAHAIGARAGRIEIGLDDIDISDAAGAHPTGLPAGRYARLTIADNGSGMDALTLQRIFEPFYTTKGVGEGTGLGLSVVHGIIANHGGRISVESELGQGSTFTILLPLADALSDIDRADTVIDTPQLILQ